ncbi:hypothetical protein [Pantoea ananatis]|uniref:hypothetical protein n=1 Tax=Pantoea ananas TaxID=553 RepID=UPI0023B0CF34|nr:hypothetical protein [Pantoea ananatis]
MENNKLSDVNSKSGSELIAIAHGIAENFESPATELLRELASRLECSIIRGNELQQKLDALAAENAALKKFGEKLNDMHNNLNGEGTGIQGRAEVACQQVALEAAIEEFDTIKTPATDAYLNSVRADAIESVVDALTSSGALTVGDSIVEVVKLAESLRSGTHDTADKAG